MRFLRNILYVVAAFVWLLGTAHCKLEAVSGFEILSCASEGGCHEEKKGPVEREDAGCCQLEKAQYKTEQFRILLPVPDFLPVSVTSPSPVAKALPAEVSGGILTAAPPELSASRPFLSRTALPVRAPSFAS